MKTFLFSVFVSLALTGAAFAGGVTSSPDAGPGTGFVRPHDAGRIFADSCILTLPRFNGADRKLAAYGLIRNSVTGTFYHPTGNMSLNPDGRDCSIVFAYQGQADDALLKFGGGVDLLAKDVNAAVEIDHMPDASDGNNYLIARTKANQ